MSKETKIFLFNLYLEMKIDLDEQLEHLKDLVEKTEDQDEIIRVGQSYFKFLKTFRRFEDIVSLTLTADTVNADSSEWSP